MIFIEISGELWRSSIPENVCPMEIFGETGINVWKSRDKP
jgi:hypothetical protein